MPPSPVLDLDNGILHGHENRIQRVEVGVAEANVSLAKVQTGLEYVSKTVSDGFEELGRKMDKANQQNDSIEAKVEGLTPRIEQLEKEHKKRGDRRVAVRTTVGGVALTGAGAVAVKFGESVWSFLSHLFGG